MRAISPTLRALIASRRFRVTSKCELTDQNGLWRDVTSWFGTNWFTEATWTENVDQPVSTGSITLAREDVGSGVSLAPHIGASPANQIGGEYDPFIREGQGARLSVAITPASTAPMLADFVECFIGTVDDYTVASDKADLVLNVRDLGAFVVDTQVEQKRTYAADGGGVPLEDVVQQILDDNLGAGVVTLYVPTATVTMVENVEIDSGKSVMEAVRDVALRIGWDIRYRYSAAGVSRLTLMEPVRASSTGDELTWFAANEYLAIPRLSTSRIDIRNAVSVEFTNADTGLPDSVTVTDPVSIARYDRRWMALSFGKTAPINTTAESTDLANAALSDLSTPFSDHDVEVFPCFWPVQLGDWYGFRANGIVYDTDNSFGIFGFTHTLANASGSTTFVTKGKVVGAFKEWTRRSRSEKGDGESDTPDTRELALKNFREIRRTPTRVTFGWDLDDPNLIAEIDAWEKLADQLPDPPLAETDPEDIFWRDIETDVPDRRLTGDTQTFDVDVPPHGKVQTWELLPFDINGVKGFGQRIKVLATPDIPRFGKIETSVSATSLFLDILSLVVNDPQALGGTLRVWLNYAEPVDPDPVNDDPDGTLAIAITPYTVTPSDSFTLPGGGTAQLFDNLRIHPARGKRIFVEFINSQGTSSGVVAYNLLSNGAVIDEDGEILDGAIKRAEQFAATIAPVSVYDTLPAVGRENEVAILTTDGKLYRFTGGVWTAAVPAPDISGVLTGSQLADAIITTAKFASGIKPVEILTSLPASPGAGRVALLTTDGKLYRSTPDGTGWTAAVPTTDLNGQVLAAQIADAAISTAKFAAGIRPVRIVGALPGSGDLVGDVVLLTTDNKLYRWNGSAWKADVPTTDLTGTIASAQIADAAITASKIGALAVQTANIATAAITTALIAAAAVTSTIIADGAISTPKLVAGAVTANEIAAGAITTAKIVAGAITTATIAAGAITASELSAGAVTAGKIAANAVTATEIAALAITTAKLAAGAVTANELAADSVIAGKIAAAAVSTTELAAGAITTAKIAAGAITANEIAALAITTAKLDALAVTTAKIAAGAITANEIAADTITAGQIAAGAISASEIAAGAVVAGKIGALAITAAEIAAGTITGAKIAANTIAAGNIVAGTITSSELAANSIIAGKIATGAINAAAIIVDGTITAVKLSVTSLSQISSNAGIIVTGKLQDATGARYLDLAASGSNAFLNHPALVLRADGSADFSGTVSATTFTGSGALFTSGLTVSGSYLFASSTYGIIIGASALTAPSIGVSGNDLMLGGAHSGTTLTGRVVKQIGGIPGTPIGVAGIVVTNAVPSSPGNYSLGDFWWDTGNLHLHVNTGGAWQQIV